VTYQRFTSEQSLHPFRKRTHILLAPFTGSSVIDANSTAMIDDVGSVSGVLPTTLRTTSTVVAANDTIPQTASAKSTTMIEEVVERTLFHEILPKILSSTVADRKNGTQESSKLPSSRVVNDVTIVLGVSGGCDSIALLRILHKILFRSASTLTDPSFRWNMVVAHFDHQQRHEESDHDRLFVQSLCQQLNAPCVVFKWNERSQHSIIVSSSPPDDTSFSQATARQWRRSTMQKLLSEQLQARRSSYPTEGSVYPANVFGMIVTAHHKDDSDETVLLKLLRGVHVANIAGLSPVLPCNDRNVDFDDVDFASTTSQSRSNFFGVNSSMYWVRPFIHVRKKDIVHFLKSNKYSWREDYTNQSSKYLRNRVRNELIPLLQDLMGGNYEILERRIDNLQQQSSEIRQYLNARVQEHIKEHVSNGVYLLSERMVADDVDLIMKESLYSWTLKQTQGYHVSYEQMQRVYQQLISYPNRNKWQLNLGQHWNINRYGDALRLARVDDSLWNDSMYGYDSNSIVYRGKLCPSQTYSPWTSHETPGVWLRLQLPLSMEASSYYFIQSTVGEWSEDKLEFTPPWRTKNRPIRVNEFLRGQRIPMHMRLSTPIVVMIHHPEGATDLKLVSSHSSIPPTLVAVYISTRHEWLVDREFCFLGDTGKMDDTAHQLYVCTFPVS
jgi:tRNA(Ile)-lysidine synthetase-like protein